MAPRGPLAWAAFAAIVALVVVARLSAAWVPYHELLFWLLTVAPLLTVYRSWAVFLEASVLPMALLLFRAFGVDDPIVLGLPVAVHALVWHAWPLRSAAAMGLATLLTAAWTVTLPWATLGTGGGILTATALLAAAAGWAGALGARRDPIRELDVVLCSYSGNSAHLTEALLHGATHGGANATVHRYHFVDDFRPTLDGDALAIVFPVFGWKPPWTLLSWMLRELPAGRGRPALVVYSAGGGPENAGVVAWLALRLRGWQVRGRLWGHTPLNVATFRLGTQRLWRWIDSLIPLHTDEHWLRHAGHAFARGEVPGWPPLLFPTPLLVIGALLENPWINRALYRNHAYRKRCTACGICVDACPVGRLTLVNDRPRAKGTCTLCLACINRCPTHAMQMWFLSEYGQPYRTRWPKLLIRRRTDPRLAPRRLEGKKGTVFD